MGAAGLKRTRMRGPALAARRPVADAAGVAGSLGEARLADVRRRGSDEAPDRLWAERSAGRMGGVPGGGGEWMAVKWGSVSSGSD